MRRALAAAIGLAALGGCGSETPGPATAARGSAEPQTPRAAPSVPSVPPVPAVVPAERDCTVVAPAITRITAAEIADVHATRPKDVAPAAEADLRATEATLVAVMPAQCERDGWSGAYTACLGAAPRHADAAACDVHLTPPQRDALGAAVRGHVPAVSVDLPECQRWRLVVEQMLRCDKFPQPTKDALRQALEQTMAAWTQTPPQDRQVANDACKQATDATTQSIRAMGC